MSFFFFLNCHPLSHSVFCREGKELAWLNRVLEKRRKNSGLAITWSEPEYWLHYLHLVWICRTHLISSSFFLDIKWKTPAQWWPSGTVRRYQNVSQRCQSSGEGDQAARGRWFIRPLEIETETPGYRVNSLKCGKDEQNVPNSQTCLETLYSKMLFIKGKRLLDSTFQIHVGKKCSDAHRKMSFSNDIKQSC